MPTIRPERVSDATMRSVFGFPDAQDLASSLMHLASTLDAPEDEDEDEDEGLSDRDYSCDVRLQVYGAGWALRYGDSSYDQDHRGWWGSSSIDATLTEDEARDIAGDLIAQAADQAHGCAFTD